MNVVIPGTACWPKMATYWKRIIATMRALKTNAAHSQLSTFWAINDPRLDNDTFIQNLDGEMRVQSMLANRIL